MSTLRTADGIVLPDIGTYDLLSDMRVTRPQGRPHSGSNHGSLIFLYGYWKGTVPQFWRVVICHDVGGWLLGLVGHAEDLDRVVEQRLIILTSVVTDRDLKSLVVTHSSTPTVLPTGLDQNISSFHLMSGSTKVSNPLRWCRPLC